MAKPSINYSVIGAEDVLGRVRSLGPKAISRLQQKAAELASEAEARFKSELGSAYHSQWSTHELANSATAHVQSTAQGVQVSFSFRSPGLHYVTALGGGEWADFPREPFWISRTPGTKLLAIPFPGSRARRFIQSSDTGLMAGSKKGSYIRTPGPVLWGKKTGGWDRDVIAEVGAEEGERFAAEMQEAVKSAIVDITTK